MVLVRMADEVPGGAGGARAPPRSEPTQNTIDARMNQLEGQEIFFDLPNNAGVFILHLGSQPGRGSFKAAYPNLTKRRELEWLSNVLGRAPWEEYKTVAKVTFGGGHDLAEIFGRKVWPNIPSQHLAFPRELAVIPVPPGASGLQRYMRELAIVEDFEGTAAQVVRAMVS